MLGLRGVPSGRSRFHLAGGSRILGSRIASRRSSIRARGMRPLAETSCSRGSRLCSPLREPRRDHLAMIPFVPALRDAHVHLRLSTPALVRIARVPTTVRVRSTLSACSPSRCPRISDSSLDGSRSASTFDGRRRCAHPSRVRNRARLSTSSPSSAPMVAVSASHLRTTPLHVRAVRDDLRLTSRRSRARSLRPDRGSTPALRLRSRAHLSMLPLSPASPVAPPRVHGSAFAPPRPRSAFIRFALALTSVSRRPCSRTPDARGSTPSCLSALRRLSTLLHLRVHALGSHLSDVLRARAHLIPRFR